MNLATHNRRDAIQGLWIGSELSLIEQLSIQSFLQNGHPYHLYVYDEVKRIPPGVKVLDANKIIPYSEAFQIASGEGEGSYSAFANIFRYKLLSENGGWWVDLDVICLRPFIFHDSLVLSSESKEDGGRKICNGILKTSTECCFIADCYNKAIQLPKERVQFGDTGFKLFEPLVAKHNLSNMVKAPDVFNPLNWWDCQKIFDESFDFYPSDESYSIHLWNELLRRQPSSNLTKDQLHINDCLLGKLQRRYRLSEVAL